MYALEKIKKHIADKINKEIKEDIIKPENLIYPPNPEMGDFSLACFELAKKMSQAPGETASHLASNLKTDRFISGIKAVGPYLNFSIDKLFLNQAVNSDIEKNKNSYGKNKINAGKKVMIEFSNANTHKEYHIGHLRNICFGDSVTKILAINGSKAIPVSYINDFGIHVAKTIWNYLLNKRKWDERPEDRGYILGKIYVEANEKEACEKTAKQMIQLVMKKIEERQGEEYATWKKTRQWSIEYFDKIYKELGVKFEHIFYENEFVDKGKELIPELLEKGILKKSEGAIVADFSDEKLGVLVIIRSDGTALYPVADIPLAIEKFGKYKLDESVYIVDIRQELYFKQLFALLKRMGYKQELVHLDYEFVKLPSGMMSSRTGNVITYQDLRNKMLERTLIETENRHSDWTPKRVAETAQKIAIGAMKFEMVKVSRKNVIVFDIDKALSFDGYTSAYIQYAHARIESIFQKTKPILAGEEEEFAINDLEKNLFFKLAKYPEIVVRAGENYDPAEIAKYLFDLAQNFNEYYHIVPVLKAGGEIREMRLGLLKSIQQVIKNGLGLLGIEALEEM